MPVGRRGVLGALGVAALAAIGAAVRAAVPPRGASADGSETPTVFTSTDTTTAAEADNTYATFPGGIGVLGTNNSDVYGSVEGFNSGGGGGFFGTTGALPYPAVEGDHLAGGVGVLGSTLSASSAAVEGDNASTGPAVYGNNSGGGVAVQGQSSNGISNSSIGVSGISSGSGSGIGVLGVSSNDIHSIGLYGISATGTGFYGYSGASGGVGAAGVNTTAGIGLYGQSAGGYAGLFSGALLVTGAMTVLGAKSAAVRAPDGKLRRLYSLESPESWFEDFGTAQLSGGSSTVELDPGFAGVVKTDDYHVFVTPNGETEMLHITGKTPASFVVREGHGGSSSVSFSYRVVAKRKDIAGLRLEQVDEPPVPGAPAFPTPPALPPAHPARPHARPRH